MSTELDDRIRSLMTRVAEATPLPPPFDGLDAADVRGASPLSRQRFVVWAGIAAVAVVVVVAVAQIGRSTSGSTVPAGEADTTSGSTEPVPSSAPVSTSPPSSSEPMSSATTVLPGLPWRGLATLPDELALVPLPEATSIDVVAADGTPMQITRGDYFCVLFRPNGGGACSELTSGATRQWMGGGKVDGTVAGPAKRLEYWLLNEGVSVELYEESGLSACRSPADSVPAYAGVRLWTCVVRNDAVPPYRAVFTVGSTSYVYGLGRVP